MAPHTGTSCANTDYDITAWFDSMMQCNVQGRLGGVGYVTLVLSNEKREGAQQKRKIKCITVGGKGGGGKGARKNSFGNGPHGKEVEAGVELRLEGEIQVLCADDGARES